MKKSDFLPGNKREYSDDVAMYHVEDDGTESIVRILDKTITHFEVPEKVRELGPGIFDGCVRLKGLTLKEGLKIFDERCIKSQLRSKTDFERIFIPASVESIRILDPAEIDRSNLKYSISEENEHYFMDDDILYEVGEKEEYTVLFCQNHKIRHAVINEGTVAISAHAFVRRKNGNEMEEGFELLNRIDLPDTLQVIGKEAFACCKSITGIQIPESVSHVEPDAFLGCSNLKEIKVSEKNEIYADVDGVLTDKALKTLVIYPEGRSVETYELPETIEEFGEAFAKIQCIEAIVLSKNIARIGKNAFPMECAIKKLYIRNDIKEIDSYAFGKSYNPKSRQQAIEVYVEPGFYFHTYLSEHMKSPVGDVLIASATDTSEMKKLKEMFTFRPVADGLCITHFLEPSEGQKSSPTIVIPGSLGEQPVVELKEEMFGGLSYGIEELVISEGIKRIGKSVLFGHSNLKKIVFPASVEEIDPLVFSDKKGEFKDLYVESGTAMVVSPYSYAEKFLREYPFQREVRIIVKGEDTDYLKFIEDKNGYVAKFQKGLEDPKQIVVPAEYRNKPVYKLVFSESLWGDSLPETVISLSLSENVKEIAGLSEARLKRRSSDGTPGIQVAEGNKTFWSDGIALYSVDKKLLIQVIDYTIESYQVAEGCEVIYKNACARCPELTKVILPSTMKEIGEFAFYYCTKLVEIVGIENVVSVGELAISKTKFEKKSDLSIVANTLTKYSGKDSKVVIPEGVETVEQYAFGGGNTQTVEEVVFPTTIRTLGNDLFDSGNIVKKITLPEGLECIKKGALSRCVLLTELEIPSTVKEIEAGALPPEWYLDGSALERLVVAEGNQHYCTIDHVLYNKEMSEIIYVPEEAKIEELVIPKSVKKVNNIINRHLKKVVFQGEVEQFRFDCCSLQTVEFSLEQTTIPNRAFFGCKKLENVKWPSSLKSIEPYAFSDTGLKKLELPETIEVIGSQAFSKTKIKEVELPKSVKEIGFGIVSGKLEKITVYDNIHANYSAYVKLMGDKDIHCNKYSMVSTIGNGKGGRMFCEKHKSYRIMVKSAVTEEEKYYVDMPSSKANDHEKYVFRNSWIVGAEFDFYTADACFGEMKEMKEKYALCRLHRKDDISADIADVYLKYLKRRGKALICGLIEEKNLEELQFVEQLGLIKKAQIEEFIAYAEEKKSKTILKYFQKLKELS